MDLSEVNIASAPFSVMGVAGHLGCECFSHLSLIPKYIERIYWGLKRHYAFYAEKVFNVVNVWLVAYWKCQKGLVFHNVLNHCLCHALSFEMEPFSILLKQTYFEDHSKGQLILKANCQALNSSKIQTNDLVVNSMGCVFFLFLEEIEDPIKTFWNHLTFNKKKHIHHH